MAKFLQFYIQVLKTFAIVLKDDEGINCIVMRIATMFTAFNDALLKSNFDIIILFSTNTSTLIVSDEEESDLMLK